MVLLVDISLQHLLQYFLVLHPELTQPVMADIHSSGQPLEGHMQQAPSSAFSPRRTPCSGARSAAHSWIYRTPLSTGLFVDGDSVYVEAEHGPLIRVGGLDGKADPERPQFPGRPSRDGKSFLASRQHRFFRDFAVPNSGGVLYSVRTLEGMTLQQYTCR